MIFAAGLGTRLQPLTNHLPKALVKVQGKPLIWYALQNVLRAGATRIVVNIHHFPNEMLAYLTGLDLNVPILVSDESAELLDTGGGLLYAKKRFNPHEPILIHNADVLTNCDLRPLVEFHKREKPLASLMVQNRPTTRFLLFDTDNHLRGWQNTSTNETKLASTLSEPLQPKAFNGIQMVDYAILEMMGQVRKFSITPAYLELAKHNTIAAWDDWLGQWFDVGTLPKLQDAEANFKYNNS